MRLAAAAVVIASVLDIVVAAPRCTGKETADTVCSFATIVHDFDAGNLAANPDFEMPMGSFQNGIKQGMLLDNLAPTGHYGGQPVYNTAKQSWEKSIQDANSFAPWYADFDHSAPPPPHVFFREIEATYTQADGVYDVGYDKYYPLTVAEGFPNEGRSDSNNPNAGTMRNFGFTTETRMRFTFNGGEEFVFGGDDDMWVFVDGKLLIDMGGLHHRTCQRVVFDVPPAGATVATAHVNGNLYNADPSTKTSVKGGCKPTMDNKYREFETTAVLPLAKGQTYTMTVLHAERHTIESHYFFATTFRAESDTTPPPTATPVPPPTPPTPTPGGGTPTPTPGTPTPTPGTPTPPSGGGTPTPTPGTTPSPGNPSPTPGQQTGTPTPGSPPGQTGTPTPPVQPPSPPPPPPTEYITTPYSSVMPTWSSGLCCLYIGDLWWGWVVIILLSCCVCYCCLWWLVISIGSYFESKNHRVRYSDKNERDRESSTRNSRQKGEFVELEEGIELQGEKTA